MMIEDLCIKTAVTAFIVGGLLCSFILLLGLFQSTEDYRWLATGSIIVIVTVITGICMLIDIWSNGI